MMLVIVTSPIASFFIPVPSNVSPQPQAKSSDACPSVRGLPQKLLKWPASREGRAGTGVEFDRSPIHTYPLRNWRAQQWLRDVARDWMWSEACEMLARAERLHREFFRPAGSAAQLPAWEPPVDVLETEREVLVLVALPGVDPEQVEAVIEDGDLRDRRRRACCRASCAPPSSIGWSCRKAASSGGCRLPAGRYSGVRRAVVERLPGDHA